MKLADWARQNGVHPKTALRWYTEGKLPVPARKIGQRTILVEMPGGHGERAALYARVSSHDQRRGLRRPLGRVVDWAARRGLGRRRTGAGGAGGGGGSGVVHQGFGFALDPTVCQRRALASHCGAARFAFNWGLDLVKARLEAQREDREVEVPWNLPALRREWNLAKQEAAPWWRENSKEAYGSGLDALARGLGNFSAARRAQRKGRVGFPRYRRRDRRDSCRVTTGVIRVDDERHGSLPRLGRLRALEGAAALLERARARSART